VQLLRHIQSADLHAAQFPGGVREAELHAYCPVRAVEGPGCSPFATRVTTRKKNGEGSG
jgi:hypothetical protein